jgi:hypothetical protein
VKVFETCQTVWNSKSPSVTVPNISIERRLIRLL